MSLLTKAFRVTRKEGLLSLAKKSIIYVYERMISSQLIGYFMVTLCKHKLERQLSRIRTLDDALDFAFTFSFLGISIKPAQVKKEIHELSRLLQKRPLETILEIGTANGGTLFLFAQVASPDAKIISVDLPGGPFGGGYPEWKIPLYLSFARANQRIYLLRQDSHDPRTLNKVKSILGDQKLDFLFIDGDHSYEGVKKDFEMYSPLLRKGGIIPFHDIIPDYFTRYGIRTGTFTGGVPRFWQEIKHNYKHQKVVQDYDQDGYGVGVPYVSHVSR